MGSEMCIRDRAGAGRAGGADGAFDGADADSTVAAEVEAVIGAFVRSHSREAVVSYSELTARSLFEDETSRIHLVALMPGAWAQPGGRASAFAEAEAERVEAAAAAAALAEAGAPPSIGASPRPTLPEHADGARAQLQAAARALLARAAAELAGEAVCVEVDASSHPSVLALYAVHRAALPAFALLAMNRTRAIQLLPAPGGIDALPTAPALVGATRRFASGELRAAVKSESAPDERADARSAVRTLVGSTFRAAVHEPGRDVAVLFHAPWCAHCRPLRERWAQLAAAHARARDDGVRLCEMRMPGNEAEGIVVYAFPTIMLFPAQTASPLAPHQPVHHAEPAGSAQGDGDGHAARPGALAAVAETAPGASDAAGRAAARPPAKEPIVFAGADRSVPALAAFIAMHRVTSPPASDWQNVRSV